MFAQAITVRVVLSVALTGDWAQASVPLATLAVMVAGAFTSTGAATFSVVDAPGVSEAIVPTVVSELLTIALTVMLSTSTSPLLVTVILNTVVLPRCTQAE